MPAGNQTLSVKLETDPQALAQPQVVAIGAASARSTELTADTPFVLIATVACYYRQGTVAVVATTSDHYLPAGQRRRITVKKGTATGFVAVIQASVAGSLQIHDGN